VVTDLRELDAQVAEKVMGWRRTEDRHLFSRTCFVGSNGGHWCEPKFSSDPAACTLIKKRLREAGVEWLTHDFLRKLMPRKIQGNRRWVNVKLTMSGPNRDEFVVRGAENEEEAVARFALACAEAGLLGET
jgi:hypothetical protein